MTVKENLTQLPAPSAPVYRLGDGTLVVNCRSLTVEGTNRWLPVTVSTDSVHMPAGTVVTVHSVGTTDAAGLIVIPGTEFSEKYTVTGREVGGEFQVKVPYLNKIKPIQPPQESGLPSGFIRIRYSLLVGGEPTKSHAFLHGVRLLNSSGDYCEEASAH